MQSRLFISVVMRSARQGIVAVPLEKYLEAHGLDSRLIAVLAYY